MSTDKDRYDALLKVRESELELHRLQLAALQEEIAERDALISAVRAVLLYPPDAPDAEILAAARALLRDTPQ
jgi:hypothetical protein